MDEHTRRLIADRYGPEAVEPCEQLARKIADEFSAAAIDNAPDPQWAIIGGQAVARFSRPGRRPLLLFLQDGRLLAGELRGGAVVIGEVADGRVPGAEVRPVNPPEMN